MAFTSQMLDARGAPSGRQASDNFNTHLPQSGDDDDGNSNGGRSSSGAPARAKRAQVKNACVNCQKACKKCDSGRPCQRCVKYNLIDSCVDSKRKPRKKGVKRGPYKKRRKNPDEVSELAALSGSSEPMSARAHFPIACASVTQVSGSSAPVSHTPSTAVSRSDSLRRSNSRRPRLSRTMGERVQRPPPPRVLGPGAIPILHTDPAPYDSDYSDDSSSDVPLLVQHTTGALVAGPSATHQQQQQQHPHQHYYPQRPMYGTPLATPTAGLAIAFQTLATDRQHVRPELQPAHDYHHHHRPASLTYAAPPPIRLPPIESFDHAHAMRSPPSTSSLAILTDVALGRTTEQPPAPAIHPPLPRPPGHFDHRRRSSNPENTGQQSDFQPPANPRPHHSISAGDSDASTHWPSSVDSGHSPDVASRAYMRRLSRRLHDTHIEQEYAGS